MEKTQVLDYGGKKSRTVFLSKSHSYHYDASFDYEIGSIAIHRDESGETEAISKSIEGSSLWMYRENSDDTVFT
jgi:hypothetical protein